MNTQKSLRRFASLGLAALAAALMLSGADDPKQTVNAGGLTFEAPPAWKSSPTPPAGMRRAQLKVQPVDGDDYPAEMVVFAFPGGAGTVEANIERWRKQFKDKNGNSPEPVTKKVKGKNVEVTRVETAGHYYPAQFPGRPAEPDRPDARLLGAIVIGDGTSFFIRMVGPKKTMNKISSDFDELLSTLKLEAK
jgi:hypothetical protein